MSLLSALGHFFMSFFELFVQREKDSITAFLKKITPEIKALGMDAINWAVAAGLHKTEARDAAIAKLKEDAKATGVDIEHFAENEFNALIEMLLIASRPPADGTATGS